MLKRISDKIDAKSPSRVILVFLLCLMALNFLQSFFTELAHDEAYYWMYSKYLSWGYFDHPPVIAILIKAGYFIFQNELGVRLFIVIMGAATLYFIYKLTPNASQSTSLFIMIILSVIIIQSHAVGFLAIPDLPVVFFAVLFLYLLKKYLQKDNYALAALMGLVVVAMLYSKYHGVLVLFFSLMPNFQLLKRKS
ncbi:MAG: glycosyltransferase family 39 protein, partial [Bacteroidales bacterium]|nr:glycosyltransferase family 39 protein [Bacteroidales bacterium]